MAAYNKIIKWIILIVVILSCLSVVITINISTKQQEKVTNLTDNLSYFKEFSLQTVNGNTFTQDDIAGNKVTVFNGWAPWCGPCTSEMPDLQKLNEKYQSKGLQVIGIVVDYDTSGSKEYDADIRKVIKKTGVTYPILLADQKFHDEPYIMLNNAVPGTWAIDENGALIQFVSGGKSEEEWSKYFDMWLKGKKYENEK